MRAVPLVLLTLGVILGIAGDRLAVSASAQAAIPDGSFVRDSANAVWLIVGGQRAQVPIVSASDADIAAIPDSGLWVRPAGDGATKLALGAPPAPARAS